jgi:DNA-binding IclR family transcriptional regulator
MTTVAADKGTPRTTIANLSALGKVTAVVEALTQYNRVTQIARAIGLGTGTTCRILQELMEVGWVVQEKANGRYLLTDTFRQLTTTGEHGRNRYNARDVNELAEVIRGGLGATSTTSTFNVLARAILNAGYRKETPR